MRGQKRLSPSEQILRFVENQRDCIGYEMQIALLENRTTANAAFGAWTALDSVADYIRALLRER